MKNEDKDSLLEEEPESPATPSAEDTPTDPAELSVEQLAAERDEYLELWKRAQADYKNLRRRGMADLEAGVRRSMQPLLDNLLLVLDHLEMALASPVESEDAKNFAIGVELTRKQLLAALAQEEVAEISTDGEFDPEAHQAVEMVADSDAEPGTIVATVRKGYRWRGVVLRYAQVRVAAGPADGESTGDATAEEPGE